MNKDGDCLIRKIREFPCFRKARKSVFSKKYLGQTRGIPLILEKIKKASRELFVYVSSKRPLPNMLKI